MSTRGKTVEVPQSVFDNGLLVTLATVFIVAFIAMLLFLVLRRLWFHSFYNKKCVIAE